MSVAEENVLSLVRSIIPKTGFVAASSMNALVCHMSHRLVVRNPAFVVCEEQRCKSDCASEQSDLHLYCSLTVMSSSYTCEKNNFRLCRFHILLHLLRQNMIILASLCS